MMDVYEAIAKRYSVRGFENKPIPEKVLARLQEVMWMAPTAGNRQPFKFIIVRDAEMKRELVAVCRNQAFIADAPIVMVACAWEKDAYQKLGGYMNSFAVDVAIVFDHLSLAATAEGLGTCWIGAFNEAGVKKLLNVPDDMRVVMLMPIGYPAVPPQQKARKEFGTLFVDEMWR